MALDLQRIVSDFSPPSQELRLRFGVVVSIQSGAVTVTVAGGTVQVPEVHYLNSYSPLIGDTVAMLTDGLDVLLLGAVS